MAIATVSKEESNSLTHLTLSQLGNDWSIAIAGQRLIGKAFSAPARTDQQVLLTIKTRNLTIIKTFAYGILVPKTYIWMVDVNLYLQPYASVVLNSHKEGLEVFASDFANDFLFTYNFSYNPLAKYLSFIDNGIFSVDGVLSGFLITPSEALEKLLVISSQGSSGDYPGCTDLAYQHAISDGADVLDCLVQMTKNGKQVYLGSINLMDNTLVAQPMFSSLTRPVLELGVVNGIFTFDLTWSEIQTLIPQYPTRMRRITYYSRIQISKMLENL
ncbi:glycerophosphodiester phosphodiesterase [Sarracenia purpurea var. burkii]